MLLFEGTYERKGHLASKGVTTQQFYSWIHNANQTTLGQIPWDHKHGFAMNDTTIADM